MAKPNLLFIYTDEQRYDTLRCYGNDIIEMPNLNALAESATVFNRAYVSQPVCTPSRASLLTGLTPHTCEMHHNNLTLPEQTRCLPEMISSEYTCAHIGKWHLGDEIYPQHGFSYWKATEDSYHAFYRKDRDQRDRSAYHDFLINQGVEPEPNHLPSEISYRFFRNQIGRLPEELSRPAFIGHEGSRFIREHKDKPFALYVNFLEPHMPFFSCRDSMYDPKDVTLPPNWDHKLDETAARRLRQDAQKFSQKGYGIDKRLATEDQWRTLIARYWGMCSLIDTYTGQILDTLTECGLADNTIIVFTTDHGDMMSSHNLLGKGYMFEESIRVPLLMKLPGQRERKTIENPVSQIDVVPTLLDAMGVEIPDHLQGKSRLHEVQNGSKEPLDDIFIEWHGKDTGRHAEPYIPGMNLKNESKELSITDKESLRTVLTQDNWKLNVSSIGDHELYDLNSDPYETNNVISDPSHNERVVSMVTKINQWQEKTADKADFCHAESVVKKYV